MIEWRVPQDMWEDGECWIIGGGCSMPRQFGIPEQVIQDVNSGALNVSAYSPYLQSIHNNHVIGVNMAYLLGDWLSFLYFGDRAFFKRNQYALPGFKGIVVTHTHLKGGQEQHKYIRHLIPDQKKLGLSENRRKICWNYNSGASAINMATLAGVKRVLLLGFDMLPVDTRTHWHTAYNSYRITKKSFGKFLRGFPAIAEDAKKLGIEILNVNEKKQTAIDSFPIVKLKEVL